MQVLESLFVFPEFFGTVQAFVIDTCKMGPSGETRTLLDLQQIRRGNERGSVYDRQEKSQDSYSLRDGAR